MSTEPNQANEQQLREKVAQNSADWDSRQQLAHILYDQGSFDEAATLIWDADEIPSTDLDIAFASRILSKSQPRKAIRLLTAVLEHNRGKAVQNLGVANALLHHGMVLQSARFYGAALEADPSLVNPDLEHFMLWTDDQQSLWGDFKGRRPKLGELPWMSRDPMEALKLTSRISLHTTPIRVPTLKETPAEELRNDLYQQTAEKNSKITPPPAVTIPADRVDPKHRRFDSTYGAAGQEAPAAPAAAEPAPKPKLVTPAAAPVSAEEQARAAEAKAQADRQALAAASLAEAKAAEKTRAVAERALAAEEANANMPKVTKNPRPGSAPAPGGPASAVTPSRLITAAPPNGAAKPRLLTPGGPPRESLLSPAAGVPVPSDAMHGEWYYIMNGEACGPVHPEALKDKLEDKSIQPPLKMIWTTGMDSWKPVYECPQLWEESAGQVFSQ